MAVDDIFCELDLGTIPPELDDFVLDTLDLENQMKKYNGGIALSELSETPDDVSKIFDDIEVDKEFRQYVPYFVKEGKLFDEKEIVSILSRYEDINAPCSMEIDSVEKLREHMIASYQIAHFHYILGKKYNIKGSFPRYCCGASSINVMLSLMAFGYPNAAYAYSEKYDHGYTILPFVLSDESTGEDIAGTVIIDPTYDQLWESTQVRNAVFIRLGDEWEYRTEWEMGGNLFPDRMCSIDILKKYREDDADTFYYHKCGAEYFQMAFSNPVKI